MMKMEMMIHPQKSFRHNSLIRTNKCIHEITEYICRHTMRSNNKHLGFDIIIDDACTFTVVIFHSLQGLGTILLSQHPATCKPTENKNIFKLDRMKENTSHTTFHEMEHQLSTATMCMMCSMEIFMGTT